MTTYAEQERSTSYEQALSRVRKLRAVADDERAPEGERAAAAIKADGLMFKFKIDQAMLMDTQEIRLDPEWRSMPLYPAGLSFGHYYGQLCDAIAKICDVKYQSSYVYDEETNKSWMVAVCCGFPHDLDYFSMLMTGIITEFGRHIDPIYSPELTEAENAYIMRCAGWEGHRIAHAIWGDNKKGNRVKARRLFKEEAERRGEDPTDLLGQGTNIKAFRTEFAYSFYYTLTGRIRALATERGDTQGMLVLRSAKARVEEMFWDRFPHLRPQPAAPVKPASTEVGTDGAYISQDECAKCKKAKSGYCREHAWLRPSTRTYYVSSRTVNVEQRGRERGAAAARKVDLGGSATGRVSSNGNRRIS
jgi:hypothetical protein